MQYWHRFTDKKLQKVCCCCCCCCCILIHKSLIFFINVCYDQRVLLICASWLLRGSLKSLSAFYIKACFTTALWMLLHILAVYVVTLQARLASGCFTRRPGLAKVYRSATIISVVDGTSRSSWPTTGITIGLLFGFIIGTRFGCYVRVRVGSGKLYGTGDTVLTSTQVVPLSDGDSVQQHRYGYRNVWLKACICMIGLLQNLAQVSIAVL